MAKSTGLGDNLYVGGYNLSGDIGALSSIHGGPATLDVTPINAYAHQRLGGERTAEIDFSAFFDGSAGASHPVLSALPRADVLITYARGVILGNAAACMTGKQVNYDGTRGADGSLTFAVGAQSDGFGLEWGSQLTPGLRTDTAATAGTSIDTTSSLAFGAQAYLQVTAFTGTDVTIKVRDSANNSSFSDVTGLAFTTVTAAPFTQRLATANTATIREYLNATTSTSAGFTSLTFSVVVVKNRAAGVAF